jgi:transketolase
VTSFEQVRLGCHEKDDIYREYATDFGRFGMHSCNLINPHVEVSSGSLGHGLPCATGIAKALQLRGNKTSRVYVVCGDGEIDTASEVSARICKGKISFLLPAGVTLRNGGDGEAVYLEDVLADDVPVEEETVVG